MRNFIIGATALVFLFVTSNAQITTFQKTFGYNSGFGEWGDNANNVFQLNDSTILVFSQSFGFQAQQEKVIVTKFSAYGNEIFEKSYGIDSIYFIIGHPGTCNITYQKGFAIAGNAGKNNVDTWATLWMFNEYGDSILQLNYGSIGFSDTLEIFGSLIQLYDSGFIMIGTKALNQDLFPVEDINPNLYLVRTDKSGNMLWQRQYDKSFDDEGNHIQLYDSTHVIISGYKHAYNSLNDTPWVFVADLEGNIVKEKSFTNPPYNCFALIGPRLFSSIDGSFYFTGCLNGALYNGAYENPSFIAKMDTNLNFIWERDFNSANLIYIYHAEQMEDSSIMVVGVQIDSVNSRVWGWVSKLDNHGNTIWDKLYKQGSSFINYLYDIDQTFDCGFVVSGSMNNGDQQSWLLKMDKFGCINPVCDTTASSCGIGIPTFNSESQSISTRELDASIYPNPASEVVEIFYSLPPATSTAQLMVFDLNGKKVYDQKLLRATHLAAIDVSAWPAGLYVCDIKSADALLTKKIIVGR